MAKFFVGQRVRIINSLFFPEYIGKETVITEPLQVRSGFFVPSPWLGYGVQIDPFFNPPAEFLEPLQYDGMQPVEWSECLWQPEGVTV